MKMMKNLKKFSSLAVSIVLVAAIALGLTACDNGEQVQNSKPDTSQKISQSIGDGKTAFDLEVVHKDGTVKTFAVKTDAKTVGEALLENDIVSGEDGEYGLYIKTVDGETLVFEDDGYYWSFLIDGVYANEGVDATDIENGKTYSLKATK